MNSKPKSKLLLACGLLEDRNLPANTLRLFNWSKILNELPFEYKVRACLYEFVYHDLLFHRQKSPNCQYIAKHRQTVD